MLLTRTCHKYSFQRGLAPVNSKPVFCCEGATEPHGLKYPASSSAAEVIAVLFDRLHAVDRSSWDKIGSLDAACCVPDRLIMLKSQTSLLRCPHQPLSRPMRRATQS